MEADRAQTDLGEAVNVELEADSQDSPKQPKKRFIGRKAAAERAKQDGSSRRTIEDSGAIQGLFRNVYLGCYRLTIYSSTTKTNSSNAQSSTSKNPQ